MHSVYFPFSHHEKKGSAGSSCLSLGAQVLETPVLEALVLESSSIGASSTVASTGASSTGAGAPVAPVLALVLQAICYKHQCIASGTVTVLLAQCAMV